MSTLQIRNIRWLSPADNQDFTGNLRICDGRPEIIERLAPSIPTMDGTGLWLMPAFVDLAHHLMPQRHIDGADISSELMAARRCGIGTAAILPDAYYRLDERSSVERISNYGQQPGHCRSLPLGALTAAGENQQLSNMAALQQAGCPGLSPGGAPLPALDLLRQAMRYAADLDLTLFLPPRMPGLDQGCAHDGAVASALGLSGIPSAAESVAVACIAALVEDTGCRVHLSQLSSAQGAHSLARAKQRGLPITADVPIWNLIFDQQALLRYDSHFHLHPPLRTGRDRDQLLAMIATGEIDAIVSQHRPLNHDAKFGPFPDTEAGASSIDTFLPLLLSLVDAAHISPLDLARCSSLSPGRILGHSHAHVEDTWIVIDPRHALELNAESMHSAAKNSPMLGQPLCGSVAGWLNDGSIELFQNWQDRLGV